MLQAVRQEAYNHRMRGVTHSVVFAALLALLAGACSNSLNTVGPDSLDLQAPVLIAVSPTDGQTGVPVTAGIVLQLSEPLSPIHNSDESLSLSVSGGGTVTGTLTLNEMTVTFTPDEALLYDTTYSISATGQLSDLAGNSATIATEWSFTTESSPSLIYVSVNGSDANDGLTASGAVKTIARAFDRASESERLTVAVGPGVYTETVDLKNGILLSGHTAGWKPAADPSTVILRPVPPVAGEPAVAVRAHNVSGAGMRNLTIEAPDGVPGVMSGTSYGIAVTGGAEVALLNMVIVSGDGADGEDGQAGEDASQIAAAAGGAGVDSRFHDRCLTIMVPGGSPPAGAGGGGLSGKSDRSCDIINLFQPAAGGPGLDADATDGVSYGVGGTAGVAGVSGSDGLPGRPGDDGEGGGGAQYHGAVVTGLWNTTNAAGGDGAGGTPGTGGGGGGGGGGYGDGAGGHTGGSGGAGGAGGLPAQIGGTGGTGGGSSFGVFVTDSTVSLTNVTIYRGSAGDGGAGGPGGAGQPGGPGGPGGAGDEIHTALAGIDISGGDGGAGGRGGYSGGGGGGAGGHSAGLFALNAVVEQIAVQMSGGAAGSGGPGGAGADGNSGKPGADGTVEGTLAPPGNQ